MNIAKIKEAQKRFLERYPEGFDDEALQPIKKRHKTEKFAAEAHELFSESNFGQPEVVCANFAKMVSRSSLISLFEKPKVKEAVAQMSIEQKDMLSIALYELLHGDRAEGFEDMVELLARFKLAKWSIVSLIPYYFARERDYFIKPTTTKNIINFFELEGVVYKPRPSYDFYNAYTAQLQELKRHISVEYSDDNAAFTGMLMIGMEE